MKNFKRTHAQSTVGYSAPSYRCFACNDTGIVHNSDRLVNGYEEFTDYEIQKNAKGDLIHLSGSDLAIICTCSAAFPRKIQLDTGESTFVDNYRRSDGSIQQVETERGSQSVGVSAPKYMVQELDRRRRRVWEDSVAEYWRANAQGERPYFIGATREHLESLGSILGSLRPESSGQTGSNSQTSNGYPSQVPRPDLPRFPTV